MRLFFTRLYKPISVLVAVLAITACGDKSIVGPTATVAKPDTVIAKPVVPAYTLTSFSISNPDVDLGIGGVAYVDVTMTLSGVASSIPTSTFIVEPSSSAVVTVSSVAFDRTDHFLTATGMPETVIKQRFLLSGIKAGYSSVTVTHSLSSAVHGGIDVNVYSPVLVTFTASQILVLPGGGTSISWNSIGATECIGLGGENGWAGNKLTSGAWFTGPLYWDTEFTLQCSNAIGISTVRVKVSVLYTPKG